MTLTKSLEDYLEAVLILEKDHDEVRVTDIANFLDISKPSVNKAVKILKDEKLIDFEKYGKIKLTAQGTKIAKDIFFRHQTLKKFLMDDLGIDKETAESEACAIEHVISKESLYKLIEYSKKVKDEN